MHLKIKKGMLKKCYFYKKNLLLLYYSRKTEKYPINLFSKTKWFGFKMIKKNEGAIKHLLPRFKVVFITVKLKPSFVKGPNVDTI